MRRTRSSCSLLGLKIFRLASMLNATLQQRALSHQGTSFSGRTDTLQQICPRSVRSPAAKAGRLPVMGAASVASERPTGMQRPDASGRFGRFGGKYVPETLITALAELEAAYAEVKNDPQFKAEFAAMLKDYVGRESPLYHADRLSEHYRREDGSRPEIYLKREDLNHTGAHKINNSLGQALLCRRLGKKRIVAETGAGQHGVATATVCANFGLECIVYMGAKGMKRQKLKSMSLHSGTELLLQSPDLTAPTLRFSMPADMERQKLNVFRMRLLGAEVRPVNSGTATLKDATSEAIRDWVTNCEDTHYILGSAAGPHPYPMMVRDFQAVIGRETRQQCLEKLGRDPDVLLACVGGGSNAIGLFHEFVDDAHVRLIGVEAAGEGVDTQKHAATITKGSPGVLHGSFSLLLQDAEGQVIDPHSISAGLDYPGIGPEHSYLSEIGRAEYFAVTDKQALDAFVRVSRLEGIIPALETSHAFAYLEELCPQLKNGTTIVINLSGRGDKDVNTAAEYLKELTVECDIAPFASLVWEGYMGAQEPAYLLRQTVNLEQRGQVREETLSSGHYSLIDIRCKCCHAAIGWQYLRASNPDQQYKVGCSLVRQSQADLVEDDAQPPPAIARQRQPPQTQVLAC